MESNQITHLKTFEKRSKKYMSCNFTILRRSKSVKFKTKDFVSDEPFFYRCKIIGE